MKYYHYYDGMKCKQVKVGEFRKLEAIALITFNGNRKYITIYENSYCILK